MSRRYDHADRYLERKRTLRIVGISAIVVVGLVTAVLVYLAVAGGA